MNTVDSSALFHFLSALPHALNAQTFTIAHTLYHEKPGHIICRRASELETMHEWDGGPFAKVSGCHVHELLNLIAEGAIPWPIALVAMNPLTETMLIGRCDMDWGWPANVDDSGDKQ